MILTKIPKDSIKKIKVYYNEGRKKTAKQIQKELGCQYMINTTLFNMSTHKAAGYLTVDNKVYGAVANPYGFAVKDDKIVFSYGNNVKYPDFTGCYHVLVRDGKAQLTDADSKKYGYTARSCVGLTAAGDIVMLCDQSNRSLKNGVGNDMLKAGCVVALNYDGGGSSQGYFNGRWLTSGRNVLAFLCVWTEDVKEENTPNTNTTTENGKKICLDAGHGSTCSNGAPDGSYKEYEFAWDVANQMKTILESHGVTVKMTRTDDTDMSLSKRVNISNNFSPDYFVSIHSNASGSGSVWNSASGWEIYVPAKGGSAEKLAKKIEEETMKVFPLNDRGIKTASYTVLTKTKAPAVLIEHGFHTNKADVEYLKSNEYRQKYAVANCKGILAALGISYVEPTSSGGNSTTEPTKPNAPTTNSALEWAKSKGYDATNYSSQKEVIDLLYNLYNS